MLVFLGVLFELELVFVILKVLQNFFLIIDKHGNPSLNFPRSLSILSDKIDLNQLSLIQIR